MGISRAVQFVALHCCFLSFAGLVIWSMIHSHSVHVFCVGWCTMSTAWRLCSSFLSLGCCCWVSEVKIWQMCIQDSLGLVTDLADCILLLAAGVGVFYSSYVCRNVRLGHFLSQFFLLISYPYFSIVQCSLVGVKGVEQNHHFEYTGCGIFSYWNLFFF